MLTHKQRELLVFLDEKIAENGISPSFEEIREQLGLKSKSGVHRLVSALHERGFIRRLSNRARAIEVIKMPDLRENTPNLKEKAAHILSMVTDLPVMGRIAAGVPIEAISAVSHHIAVPNAMLSQNAGHYALEVKGDSMVDLAINDGDTVIIREQSMAYDGDIIVALVDDHEATLKRFRRQGNMIALEAANPAYETRILPEERVKVQGRLVGLMRNY